MKHEASLQVDESSLARTFVDMQSPESNKYNDSVRAREDVWSRLTRVHAESPHYGASGGAPADKFPSSISSIAKERSDGAVFSKSGQDGTYRDGEALPTSTIRVRTQQDEPSDPSDGSSSGTSDYSTASVGSFSDSSSDSDGSGYGGNHSTDNDETSDSSESSSGNDDSSSNNSESSSDSSSGSSFSDLKRTPKAMLLL